MEVQVLFAAPELMMARWRSSYAAVCKTVNAGANPVRASSLLYILSLKPAILRGCSFFCDSLHTVSGTYVSRIILLPKAYHR